MDLTTYTWEVLATAAGATAATLLIVQYLKDLIDRFVHVPTRAVVLIVALAIAACAKAFTGGIALSDAPLLIINAFVVAFAAMGAYDSALMGRIGVIGVEGEEADEEDQDM